MSVHALAFIQVLYTQGVYNLPYFRFIIFFNFFLSRFYDKLFISYNYVIFHLSEMLWMNRETPVYTEKQYTSSVATVGYPYLGEAFCLFFISVCF